MSEPTTKSAEGRTRVAVLISGRGSNMATLADACAAQEYPARIAVVLSNEPDAGGLAIAAERGIATAVVDHRPHGENRAQFEAAIDEQLAAQGIEDVCLAGFMRILTPWFVNRWKGRILNIHPSLLPSFKGLDTHQRALDAGVCWHGATVHVVTPALDDGPIIAQAAVPTLPEDDAESLRKRVLQAEHQLYPRALRLFCAPGARVEGDRFVQADLTFQTPNTQISPLTE
ncbi:MAG: phosphoribosylglycinamide formyltransferase [Pseudomonadota bacterium]